MEEVRNKYMYKKPSILFTKLYILYTCISVDVYCFVFWRMVPHGITEITDYSFCDHTCEGIVHDRLCYFFIFSVTCVYMYMYICMYVLHVSRL